MRHKVPRLRQKFTIQGMSPGDLLLAFALAFGGWYLAGLLTGNILFKLLIAIGIYYTGTAISSMLKMRIRPGALNTYIRWLTSKDIYVPMPDEKVRPLIVPQENTDAQG